MTDKQIVEQHHATFESILNVDESGNEYWALQQNLWVEFRK